MNTKRYYFNCHVWETYTAYIDVPKEIASAEEARQYTNKHHNEIELAVDVKASDVVYDFSWSKLVDE